MANEPDRLNRPWESDAELSAELKAAGEAVAGLPPPVPPAGLVARTMARLRGAGVFPAARRRPWWIRPITHPLARAAAALFLASSLSLVVNEDRAERVGRFVEGLLGPSTTGQLEALVDRVLSLKPDLAAGVRTPSQQALQSRTLNLRPNPASPRGDVGQPSPFCDLAQPTTRPSRDSAPLV